MSRAVRIGLVSLAALVASASIGADRAPLVRAQTRPGDLSFVPASPELLARCRATAKKVGYPVPCPTRVPAGLTANHPAGPSGCVLDIIGPGGVDGCARSWRGWVVGSSEVIGKQHLVITASPRTLRTYAKVVNGPAWYPEARVRPLAWVSINRWRMRAVYAPPRTNDGSAFMSHVVLIWTVGGHTYGVGFHNLHGVAQTLELDKILARGIKLVAP
jgi:hypothetical protein